MPHAHGAPGTGDSQGPAHCTAELAGLSHHFVVCCDDATLGRYVENLLGSLRLIDASSAATAPARYELTRASTSVSASASAGGAGGAGGGRWDLHRDGDVVVLETSPGGAVATLVWDVNRLAAERSGQHLLFHSGGLEAPGGIGILVPAASGSGKSTLTAGLAQAGLGYLSDELVAFELDGAVPGRLLPYPKPVTVKPGSFSVLAAMDPGPFEHGWFGAGAVGEWQVPVGNGTGRRVGAPCRPGYVIVPRYDPSAGTALTRLSETEAFFSLALHAVNMLPHGADATAAIGRLAADCECYTLAMSDLDAACALVLGLVGARV